MKRIGFVIEEIVEWSNLNEAFDTVVCGTKRKQSKEGRWLIAHREKFLRGAAEEIKSGHIDLGKSHETDIVEAGKLRHLQIFEMKTRIKVAAVMIPVDRHLRKRYIRTTASSIKKRGVHDLKAYIERDIRQDPHGTMYGYKFDISKCYDTVVHDFVRYALARIFKDKKLLGIFDQFLSSFENSVFEKMYEKGVGISMGLRSSQGFLNTLLSVFLDHYMKDRNRIKHDYRYCDDGLTLNGMKRVLWKHRDIVHERIESIGQKVKPNERVFPISEGLDFLGVVIYPTHTLMRKRVKKNFARRLKKVRSRKRRVEIVGSLWGMAKHADCWHLLEKLLFRKEFVKLKRKVMKDFGTAKSDPKTIDGKKSFRGSKISGKELEHKPFIVVDYETGVIPKIESDRYKREVDETLAKGGDTKLVKKPRPKYVVSIIYNGQLRKLWTGDKENWDELDRRREEPDGLPFFCSMETDYTGQFPKYTFCSATALGYSMPTDAELESLYQTLKIR